MCEQCDESPDAPLRLRASQDTPMECLDKCDDKEKILAASTSNVDTVHQQGNASE